MPTPTTNDDDDDDNNGGDDNANSDGDDDDDDDNDDSGAGDDNDDDDDDDNDRYDAGTVEVWCRYGAGTVTRPGSAGAGASPAAATLAIPGQGFADSGAHPPPLHWRSRGCPSWRGGGGGGGGGGARGWFGSDQCHRGREGTGGTIEDQRGREGTAPPLSSLPRPPCRLNLLQTDFSSNSRVSAAPCAGDFSSAAGPNSASNLSASSASARKICRLLGPSVIHGRAGNCSSKERSIHWTAGGRATRA